VAQAAFALSALIPKDTPMKKPSAKKSSAELRARVPKLRGFNHNPKEVGEAIEALFTYEMKKRGMTIATPEGDSARYDRLVDRGANFPADGLGRHITVQIRGALRQHRRYRCFHVNTVTHTHRRFLMPEDAAVLAAYVACKNVWYFIPVRLFAPRSHVTLYPGIESSNARFEQWLERWELLAPGRANRNILLEWMNHPPRNLKCPESRLRTSSRK
jgi:hypothetical protein